MYSTDITKAIHTLSLFSFGNKEYVYYAEGQNDDLGHADMFMVLIIKEKAE